MTSYATVRRGFWKYLGAMFMEAKGPDGEQAVSFTRLLGLILFIACLGIWLGNFAGSPDENGVCAFFDVPQGMLYTLWWLIGVKGAKDFAIGLRKRNGN